MQSLVRSRKLSLGSLAAVATLAVAGLGAAGAAHAGDVFWSVGVQAAPGVQLGFSNAPQVYAPQPVYYAPQPVYYAPPPVVYAPQPVYYNQPRVVYQPAPVFVRGRPFVREVGWAQAVGEATMRHGRAYWRDDRADGYGRGGDRGHDGRR